MKTKLINIVLILFMLISFSPIPSYAGEVYTSESVGHYKNPVDGTIEDPGNNPGIGEGMVSNVVSGISLIEKDDDGKLYATVRYRLKSNIRDIKVWIMDKESKKYIQIPVSEVKTGNDTGDYRFQIPSTDTVVKSSFYVTPMGRDVVFFITFGNLQKGSGDFKVFVSSGETTNVDNFNNKNDLTNKDNSSSSDNNYGALYNDISKTKNRTAENSKIEKTIKEDKLVKKDKKNENKKGFEHGLLTNKDYNDVLETNTQSEKYINGPVTNIFILFFIIVCAVLFSLFILGAIAIYIMYLYKKRVNNNLEKNIKKSTSIEKNFKVDLGKDSYVKNKFNYELELEQNRRISNDKNDIWNSHPGFSINDDD